ncbi:hypothetical protein SDC9_212894 [bioreactor metagenome]|uniref:Uncharacterized protein n=1 Tax=bioreactor metagenome TaxID=1076179 RepID=A0A645JN85_9ZZZZ
MRRAPFAGRKGRLAARARELILMQDRRPRVVLIGAGPLQIALFEPLVAHAGVGGIEFSYLLEYIFRAVEAPLMAET